MTVVQWRKVQRGLLRFAREADKHMAKTIKYVFIGRSKLKRRPFSHIVSVSIYDKSCRTDGVLIIAVYTGFVGMGFIRTLYFSNVAGMQGSVGAAYL